MLVKDRTSARVAAPHPRLELACRQFGLHPLPVNTGRGQIHYYFLGLTPKTKNGGNALAPSHCGERAEIETARKPWRSSLRGGHCHGA
jgi:hypothetical protein